MATVFSHTPLQGDTWDMQGALIYFSNNAVDDSGKDTTIDPGELPTEYNGAGYAPIVAVGINLSLQRGVTKRYPINVRRVIYMVGHPDGQMTIQCLFGPDQSMSTFLETFNSIGTNTKVPTESNGNAIFIRPFGSINGGSSKLGLGTWKITDPVINAIGLQISESGSQQVPAIAQVSFTFTGLNIE